jgi:hypothetical protein
MLELMVMEMQQAHGVLGLPPNQFRQSKPEVRL